MKDSLKQLKKHWALIWLLAVIVIAMIFIGFGAYTGLKSVKRVVTTKESPGELFSSNCMKTTLAPRRINSVEYTVTVCNYEQQDPQTANPSNITYSLLAEIRVLYDNDYLTMSQLATLLGPTSDEYKAYEDKIADRSYSIYKSEDDTGGPQPAVPIELNAANGYTTTFSSETLAKDVSSTDKFKVKFDDEELSTTSPEFYIYLKAIPTSNLSILESLLGAAQSTSDVSAWQGSFVESDTSSKDYDFYNYIISGSGSGSVDIIWDNSWLEINPFFFTAASGNVVTFPEKIVDPSSQYNGWFKATLTVNSTEKNRYEMVLYKAKENTTYVGANAPSNYITCVFTPSTQ